MKNSHAHMHVFTFQSSCRSFSLLCSRCLVRNNIRAGSTATPAPVKVSENAGDVASASPVGEDYHFVHIDDSHHMSACWHCLWSVCLCFWRTRDIVCELVLLCWRMSKESMVLFALFDVTTKYILIFAEEEKLSHIAAKLLGTALVLSLGYVGYEEYQHMTSGHHFHPPPYRYLKIRTASYPWPNDDCNLFDYDCNRLATLAKSRAEKWKQVTGVSFGRAIFFLLRNILHSDSF